MSVATIEVTKGRLKGRRFVLEEGETLVIGRSPDSDIHVPDREVSRFHCRLQGQGDGVLLVDFGSFNGTRVNGRRVKTRVLKPRDTFTVGTNEFLVAPSGASGRALGRLEVRVAREARPVKTVLKEHYAGPSLELAVPWPESVGSDMWRWADAFCRLAAKTHEEKAWDAILAATVDTMLAVPGVVRGAVVLQDPRTLELDTVAYKAKSSANGAGSQAFVLSRSVVQDTLDTGVSIVVHDTRDDRRYREKASIVGHEIRSAMCVPLRTDRKVIGALYVDSGPSPRVFGSQELRLLATIGHQAGAALVRARLIEDLEALFLSTVRSMAAAIELKDPYTRGHSERVTAFALMLADELVLSRDFREVLELSGLLHDVGKIGVPERVLLKPGRPSDEEWALIKRHPEAGVSIVKHLEHCDRIVRIPDLVDAIRHHHERYDGTGYPAGLKGEQIPLAARILAVADTFDAITSDRVYRKGRAGRVAMRIIEANAGTQFEPSLVDAFRRVFERGEIHHPELVPGRFHKTRVRDTMAGTPPCGGA